MASIGNQEKELERATSFAADAHRQSLVVSRSEGERKDQAFIDAVSDR